MRNDDFLEPGSKEQILKEALKKKTPVLALCFQNEKKGEEGPAILFATRSRGPKEFFFPISVKVSENVLSFEEPSTDEQESLGFVMAGIGNRGALRALVQDFETFLNDEVNTYGPHKNLKQSLLRNFTTHLVEEFRSADYDVPYCVELLLVYCLGGSSLEMFRIKTDGDYRAVTPYCILGGYQKFKNTTTRERALRLLRNLYRKGLPNRKSTERAARKILSWTKDAGEYTSHILSFSEESSKT